MARYTFRQLGNDFSWSQWLHRIIELKQWYTFSYNGGLIIVAHGSMDGSLTIPNAELIEYTWKYGRKIALTCCYPANVKARLKRDGIGIAVIGNWSEETYNQYDYYTGEYSLFPQSEYRPNFVEA